MIISTSFSSFAKTSPVSKHFLGKANYSWLFFDVYSATLWGKKFEGKVLFSKPVALELKYNMELSGHDICERSFSEISKQGVDEKIIQRIKKTINCIFPDMKKGDTILANFTPEQGLTFISNGNKTIGSIKNISDSITFLKIWLGEHTSDKKFRKKILGEVQ